MNRHFSGCLEPVAVTTAALFSKKGFQKNQARLLGFSFSPSIGLSPWKTTPAKVQPSLSEQNQVSVLHGGVGRAAEGQAVWEQGACYPNRIQIGKIQLFQNYNRKLLKPEATDLQGPWPAGLQAVCCEVFERTLC